ncbi:hypothetical protein PIB30_053742 [Stylosanthes scabra]|uniref:Uncharacterized protein n=1 Tax=Stylosanthes scabra TaxID=79078 RepID=A0ABU6YHW5_9FABA|nr:hypothetical protein [Stylosanthes scabra]
MGLTGPPSPSLRRLLVMPPSVCFALRHASAASLASPTQPSTAKSLLETLLSATSSPPRRRRRLVLRHRCCAHRCICTKFFHLFSLQNRSYIFVASAAAVYAAAASFLFYLVVYVQLQMYLLQFHGFPFF